LRSLNEVNSYLKVCRNGALLLLVKPAGTTDSKSSQPWHGRTPWVTIYLIEIHQHENVWLLLSLFYRLIDDWVELVTMHGERQFFEDLRGDLKLHTTIQANSNFKMHKISKTCVQLTRTGPVWKELSWMSYLKLILK